MPDQNPIYDFMKSNKLTDLDEKTFINKYSAPDKAKEIYSFMASNKLTDLDESKFYDKYLKKKVGGEISSLTELPSEFTEVLKKGVNPNPSQEETKAARQLGVKPSSGLIAPINLGADQKAYERELKRQDAAINTLKNTYSQKGLKFDEKSKRGQEQILGLLDKERENDLALVTGKDQKPYLVRGEGFLASAGKGLLRSIIDPIESTSINTTNDPDALADLLDEKIAEEPNVPTSAPTKFGGYLGELAGGLPKLMALLSIPYVGESAMVSEMYHNGLANQRRLLYEKGLQEGMDRRTAAANAMKNAPITAIPDAVVGAALARGPGGKAAGREIIPNAAKESFLSATNKGFKGVAKVSAIGGTAEFGRSKAQQALGYDVSNAEAIENGLRGMGDYALMDAAFKLAHAGPKYLSSAAKNLLSTVPKEVLEVAAEKYPDGQRTLDEVAKFTETKATVQDFVPEEKVAAVTGLTEKVQNLEKNIKELEEKKKTSSQALHPFMDGWIKEYQDEIDFYKKQVDKVVKSKDPTGVTEEIDDITGLKAGEKPVIQEEAIVSEEVKPTEVKEKINIENEKLKKEINEINDEKYLKNYDIFSKRGFAKEFGFDKVPEEGGDRVKYLKYRNEYLEAILDNLDLGIANKKYTLSEDFIDLQDRIENEYDANAKELKQKNENFNKVKPTEVDLTTAEKMNVSQNRYGIVKDGAEAGFIVTTNPKNNVVKIKGVTVNEELRGKNIAGDAYVKLGESLAKEGVSLESDSFDKMEASATRVWEKLVDKGLAVKGENSYQFKPTEVKETIKTKENAIQKPSAGRVLQPEQEGVRETGGERKRVEQGVKGEEVTKEGKQVEGDEKVVAKKTYQEAVKEKLEADKKRNREAGAARGAITKEVLRRVDKMDAPADAEQIALRYLADGGRVSKGAVDEAYGSVKRAQLNVKRREFLSEEVKSKDFVGGEETLDEVAHKLWERSGQKIPESEIKNALMAEIGSNNTRAEAAEAYLDRYSPEYKLEKEEMRLAEQYEQEYLEEQAKIEEELRKPLDEQVEGEASEEHINNLINQYEAEIKGQDQQLRPEGKGEAIAEARKGEAVEKAPKGEEKLAQEYKEVVKKASKKAKENAKKDFVDRNFDSIVAKLKIQIKCPT